MSLYSRRHVLVGAGIAVSLAGCVDSVPLNSSGETSSDLSVSLPPDDRLSAEEVVEATDESVVEYGHNGFWGLAESQPEHELEITAGWMFKDLFADDDINSRHIALLYEFPEDDFEGKTQYSLWTWGLVDPPTDETVTELAFELQLPSVLRMIDHSPKGTSGDDRIPVGFDNPEAATVVDGAPQIHYRHSQENIALDVGDSSFGWGGSYRVAVETSRVPLSLTTATVLSSETPDVDVFENIEWTTSIRIE
ncbi:hypothetical protein [Natronococcus occultus]|uniref:Uncharacterized protein n=1 Tax=Natronococcus occultus SP4 TaxID=694430 RepID=L0K0R3_9EURY|nr:hypothetical protein [Natronococcus occultus]AGB37929.1 hypothetical protein Natoc_2145 [Natronococcus occultus SP4]